MSELIIIISRYGMLIDLAEFSKVTKTEIDQLHISVQNVTIIGKKRYTKTLNLYRYVRISGINFLAVARFAGIPKKIMKLCPGLKIRYKNRIIPGTAIDIGDDSVDLEEHQNLCVEYMINNIYSPEQISKGRASCMLVMDTGLGKTYVAGALIEHIKRKTLIIIPNTSNLEGWYALFQLYFPSIKLGEYHAKKKIDGDVVITTIRSALSDKFTSPHPHPGLA